MTILTSKNVSKQHKKVEKDIGTEISGTDCEAFMVSEKHNFKVYFREDQVSLKTIVHESFHLTHYILDWMGDGFNFNQQENGAFLCEYLVDLILGVIKDKFKIKVV